MRNIQECAGWRHRLIGYFKREDVFPVRLCAGYTVEAAAVMGICMIFIGLLFMGGISLYGSAMETIACYEAPDPCPQKVFLISRTVQGLLDNEDADEGGDHEY